MRHASSFARGIHPNGVAFTRPWPLRCFTEMSATSVDARVTPITPEHSAAIGNGFLFDDPDIDGLPAVGEAEDSE